MRLRVLDADGACRHMRFVRRGGDLVVQRHGESCGRSRRQIGRQCFKDGIVSRFDMGDHAQEIKDEFLVEVSRRGLGLLVREGGLEALAIDGGQGVQPGYVQSEVQQLELATLGNEVHESAHTPTPTLTEGAHIQQTVGGARRGAVQELKARQQTSQRLRRLDLQRIRGVAGGT
jgi:hypothetical protein